jgi:hypothetical protein
MDTTDRLEIVVEGHRQPAMPTPPASAVNFSPWKDIVPEQHALPPVELPDDWAPYHLVVFGLCSKPVNRFCFESGSQRHDVFRKRYVGLTSAGKLRAFRTDAPSHIIAVSIEREAMQGAILDRLHGRDVQSFHSEGREDSEIRRLALDLHHELAAGCPRGQLRGESICAQLP